MQCRVFNASERSALAPRYCGQVELPDHVLWEVTRVHVDDDRVPHQLLGTFWYMADAYEYAYLAQQLPVNDNYAHEIRRVVGQNLALRHRAQNQQVRHASNCYERCVVGCRMLLSPLLEKMRMQPSDCMTQVHIKA